MRNDIIKFLPATNDDDEKFLSLRKDLNNGHGEIFGIIYTEEKQIVAHLKTFTASEVDRIAKTIEEIEDARKNFLVNILKQ